MMMMSIFQNLFAMQTAEQSDKIIPSQYAMEQQDPTEKPHTLEEYSYDHFRLGLLTYLLLLYGCKQKLYWKVGLNHWHIALTSWFGPAPQFSVHF